MVMRKRLTEDDIEFLMFYLEKFQALIQLKDPGSAAQSKAVSVLPPGYLLLYG